MMFRPASHQLRVLSQELTVKKLSAKQSGGRA